ncbi:mitochondrial small ribosomal subunit Rsm22-domain-containing protein [Colletotrichum godetiae]|uniref:Mitochondrial small ribosomal subunit Rsm22-domain-containing protein n=1 Tax=Colletotrichum godetiae TaxID=1209918 RepID=A0AAJ0F4X1_9PEZI|nr:mitochondrial small ribosomal subunit Rsm22-domain-containing protein [Colletotrichum godetiae]KAK1700877.1 mitochondrial small ribosomal subunit Rsm22-domain-containing protein [Colletotrichum godetiae]
MLTAGGLRNACPSCRARLLSLTGTALASSSPTGRQLRLNFPRHSSLAATRSLDRRATSCRPFSTTSRSLQDPKSISGNAESLARTAEIEKTVREARQRFRDTLPKGYLSEEEYTLYERWYGPPLRETSPEDVGIQYLNDEQAGVRRRHKSGGPTLLRQVQGGTLQEVQYARKKAEEAAENDDEPVNEKIEEPTAAATEVNKEAEPTEEAPSEGSDKYINMVARNKREYDALRMLQKDFEANARAVEEESREMLEEDELRDEEREFEEDEEGEEEFDESQDGIQDQGTSKRSGRLHPFSREGHFSTNPSTVSLPYAGYIGPVTSILDRTDIKHVKEAAEKAFGGPGLPHSPATPASKMGMEQQAIGMAVWQNKMSDIEADAFVSAFLPPAYASAMGSLVEVRKRLGTDWLRNLFNNGSGPRVLDVGAGGAGLLAWQDVSRAEWDAMKSREEVTGKNPPGKQSVVVGSEKLRTRVTRFLQNTTFLPRLPDYHHSVETAHLDLDANENPQPRKMFDIIIASHLMLPVKEGHRRKAILNNIWSLLNPQGGVLIVLEKGQPRGFEAVAEVRERLLTEFLIPPGGEDLTNSEEKNPAFEREKEPGMIIAPCTNHRGCPMYQVPGKSTGRKDFCHFSQRFVRPSFLQRIMGATHRNHDDVQFSYIAIQRGVAAKEGPLAGAEAADRAFEGFETSETAPDMLSLPRQILPPIKRRGHVTLDVCTPNAQIERWTVPKSFSKQAYHDARKAKWGDLWALGAKTRNRRNVRLGRPEVLDDGGLRAQRQKAAASKKKKVIGVDINESGVVGGSDEGRTPGPQRKTSRKAARQQLLKSLAKADEE